MYYITLHNFSIYIKVFLLYHKFFQKFFKNFFKKLLTFNSWSYFYFTLFLLCITIIVNKIHVIVKVTNVTVSAISICPFVYLYSMFINEKLCRL